MRTIGVYQMEAEHYISIYYICLTHTSGAAAKITEAGFEFISSETEPVGLLRIVHLISFTFCIVYCIYLIY